MEPAIVKLIKYRIEQFTVNTIRVEKMTNLDDPEDWHYESDLNLMASPAGLDGKPLGPPLGKTVRIKYSVKTLDEIPEEFQRLAKKESESFESEINRMNMFAGMGSQFGGAIPKIRGKL